MSIGPIRLTIICAVSLVRRHCDRHGLFPVDPAQPGPGREPARTGQHGPDPRPPHRVRLQRRRNRAERHPRADRRVRRNRRRGRRATDVAPRGASEAARPRGRHAVRRLAHDLQRPRQGGQFLAPMAGPGDRRHGPRFLQGVPGRSEPQLVSQRAGAQPGERHLGDASGAQDCRTERRVSRPGLGRAGAEIFRGVLRRHRARAGRHDRGVPPRLHAAGSPSEARGPDRQAVRGRDGAQAGRDRRTRGRPGYARGPRNSSSPHIGSTATRSSSASTRPRRRSSPTGSSPRTISPASPD